MTKRKSIWLSMLSIITMSLFHSSAYAGIFGTGFTNFRMYSGPAASGAVLQKGSTLTDLLQFGTSAGYGVISDASLPANTINTVIIYFDFSVLTSSNAQTLSARLCRNNTVVVPKVPPVCTALSQRTFSTGATGRTFIRLGGFNSLPPDSTDGNLFIDDEYYVETNYDGRGMTVGVTGIFTGIQ